MSLRALVVIPTYNERENLDAAVRAVLAQPGEFSVLVVDDASPDGTGRLADALASANPGRVSVLHRAGKLGLGSAYLAGFRAALDAGYDAVCEMDADGSHDPAVLPALAAAIEGGADLAIGSRRIAGGSTVGWGPHRHLMSGGAMLLARIVLGLKTKDVTAGFRCYRAALAEELLHAGIESGGYAFQEESVFYAEKLGYRVVEVPITFKDRAKGRSKLTWREVAQFFAVIAKLRTVKPRRRTR
jgi:dolichol-phosphate mannosyltransferase